LCRIIVAGRAQKFPDQKYSFVTGPKLAKLAVTSAVGNNCLVPVLSAFAYLVSSELSLRVTRNYPYQL